MKAIYIHGFNSAASFGNEKITALKNAGFTVSHPDLPGSPKTAIALLEDEIFKCQPDELILVGTSLGGFYALHLASKHGLKCVLLNPSMKPYETLVSQIGPRVNLRTGEEWEFLPHYIDELKDLIVTPGNPRVQTLLALDREDEVLDYRIAKKMLSHHATVLQFTGGNHRFEHIEETIPYILKMQHTMFL